MMDFEVVLEHGKKLSFATAKNWPGYSRSGKGKAAALENLAAYAPRYARALEPLGLAFPSAVTSSSFKVVQELQGGPNTDFGVPVMAWPDDPQLPDQQEQKRWRQILLAAWQAFDAAALAAEGKPLQTGPRGGGRSLERMRKHVIEAEQGYLVSLGGKLSPQAKGDWPLQRQELSAFFEEAMQGKLPALGPRGGQRWPARYFIRRQAWHLLDHAWELEDRILP